MMGPQISIIMPVYNAEKTVSRMIDAILSQTFTNWELICVNDGSTDGSLSIIEGYAKVNNKVKVINKLNAGVSAARQDGLEVANGEYVIHADSDDWVDSTMLEELYKKAKYDDADIVICDFYTNKGEKQTLIRQQPSSLEPKTVLRELFNQLHGSCWNKLARRTCFKKYNIRFPEGLNFCEDLLTWVQFLSHDEVRVSYLNKAFYHYDYNKNSITQKYSHTLFEQSCKIVDALEEYFPDNEYKQRIINKWKMNIKGAAFWGAPVFSAKEYRGIYPECNGQIMSTNSSLVNRILMRLSYMKGLFFISTRLNTLKNIITGHNTFKN